MVKYGFVYLWRDRKHSRYYVGSHWGKESDGYICSSNWMRDSRKRRPTDFRRRVLARVYTSKKELLREEYKWLSLIKDEELGKRYYNLTKHLNGHWSADEGRTLTVRQKLSLARKRYVCTDETRKKMSESLKKAYSDPELRAAQSRRLMGKNKGKKSPFKGQKRSDEVCKAISSSKLARNGGAPLAARQKAKEFGVTIYTYNKWLKQGEAPLPPEERKVRQRERLSLAISGKPRPYRQGIPSPLKGVPRPPEVGKKVSLTKQAKKALLPPKEPRVMPWEIEGMSRSKWFRLNKGGEKALAARTL